MDVKSSPYNSFKDSVTKIGKTTLLIAAIVAFIPPIVMWAFMGLKPDFAGVVAGLKSILAAWFVLWIIEPISYFPLLGTTGTYVSWLAGNIVNLRVPCSAVAQQAVGVTEGTDEGDIISTMGLCASVFVNIIVLIFFAMAGTQFLKVIPESVSTSFSYTLPAVMGAMIANFALRNWKVGFVAVAIAFLVYISGVTGGYDLLLIIFPTIIASMVLYKKKLLD